jgi:hypothetical protein
MAIALYDLYHSLIQAITIIIEAFSNGFTFE